MNSQLALFQKKCVNEIDIALNAFGRNEGQVDHDWQENGTDYGFTLIWKYVYHVQIVELIYYVDGSKVAFDFKDFDKDIIVNIERN